MAGSAVHSGWRYRRNIGFIGAGFIYSFQLKKWHRADVKQPETQLCTCIVRDYTILDGLFDILAFQLHPHIYMNIWSMPLLLIAARVSTRVPRDPATLYKYSLDTKKVMQSSLDQKA